MGRDEGEPRGHATAPPFCTALDASGSRGGGRGLPSSPRSFLGVTALDTDVVLLTSSQGSKGTLMPNDRRT